MRKEIGSAVLGLALAASVYVATAPTVRATAPLAIDSARITISGTSNIHEYTASTATARVTRAELAGPVSGADFWTVPGGVQAFEVAIPARTLTSPREGLDKNMYKALKVEQYTDITFRLVKFDPNDQGARAVGMLRIAGVEREVSFDVQTKRAGATLSVQGKFDLLMTDYGIAPPKAMLGMLKTDPKITVTFETLVAIPLT